MKQITQFFLEGESQTLIFAPFSDIENYRSYRKLTKQSIKGIFRHWQKLELFKVVHNAKLR